jgi:thiol:disulfide interchange protein
MKKRKRASSNLPRLTLILGLFVLAGAILVTKEKTPDRMTAGELPEHQLEQALEAGKPVLAFYHSNNCQSCQDMMALVDQVYPEFAGTVTLVDVDVYRQQNQSLLKAVDLRVIPTQMFYDRSGDLQIIIGVMEPEALRNQLARISTEE